MRLQTFGALRYLVPLREGGSLPAVVEVEGGGHYVTKFRGAGQGARALIAEIVVGELARRLGLPIPEIAIITLDDPFGRSEPDPEIQELLIGSVGVNVGMRFLEGAYTYDPVAYADVSPELAADIVWLDAFVSNVDRTARNTNILLQNGDIWLIDHGAALYFHHHWEGVGPATAEAPFEAIRDHVLLPFASPIMEADRRLTPQLGGDAIASLLEIVPDELFMDSPAGTTPPFSTPDENRRSYVELLTARLRLRRRFVEQAEESRLLALRERPIRKEYRR